MNYIRIYTDFTKNLRLDIQIFHDFWLILYRNDQTYAVLLGIQFFFQEIKTAVT